MPRRSNGASWVGIPPVERLSMTTAKSSKCSALSSRALPNGSMRESPNGTLINEDPWNAYHLETLLALNETYRENTKFGFLIRHYWIPATVLTFRQSSRVTFPDGNVKRQELQIERRMARCRSNECTWREIVTHIVAANPSDVDSETPDAMTELLCSYDRYEQTFHSAKPILFELPTVDQMLEARRQALYRLPLLVPPGPIPIGFSWYAKVGDDYMNYRLEAEESHCETSVLVIRREGRCSTALVEECPATKDIADITKIIPVVKQRQGVTLFAWNRGVVLEDRYLDRIVAADDNSAGIEGTTTELVMRLIRSCPTES